MKREREQIRKILKSLADVKYIIRSNNSTKNRYNMNREVFIKVVDLLKQVDDRGERLSRDLGIDLAMYEDKHFEIIETLLEVIFNQEQIDLIHDYLYKYPFEDEWDGTIEVVVKKKPLRLPFKTPEEVWEVVNRVK